MKIRTDFVTNSSSSSFVIVFEDKDSIEKTIAPYKEQIGEEYERFLTDCQESVKQIGSGEQLYFTDNQWVWEEFLFYARREVEIELREKRFGGDWVKWFEWERENKEELENLVEKKRSELFEDYKKKMHPGAWVSAVEYDDSETELEWRLRELPFVTQWWSFH